MDFNRSLPVEAPAFEPLGSHILRQVRDLILNGQVSPGDSLPETELAALFDVSRGPIRDAISALEREGLVVSEPRRRARVAVLREKDVEEIYSLRRSLEMLASERAARYATDSDFAEMRQILARMESELDDGDAIRLSHLDTAFHDVIYRAARHDRLYRVWTEVRSQVTFFLITRNKAAVSSKSRAIEEHHILLEAMVSRDPRRFAEATERHLLSAYERLSGTMKDPTPNAP